MSAIFVFGPADGALYPVPNGFSGWRVPVFRDPFMVRYSQCDLRDATAGVRTIDYRRVYAFGKPLTNKDGNGIFVVEPLFEGMHEQGGGDE